VAGCVCCVLFACQAMLWLFLKSVKYACA
jgi:hypothetical protein